MRAWSDPITPTPMIPTATLTRFLPRHKWRATKPQAWRAVHVRLARSGCNDPGVAESRPHRMPQASARDSRRPPSRQRSRDSRTRPGCRDSRHPRAAPSAWSRSCKRGLGITRTKADGRAVGPGIREIWDRLRWKVKSSARRFRIPRLQGDEPAQTGKRARDSRHVRVQHQHPLIVAQGASRSASAR
jgi:hypothetical protein